MKRIMILCLGLALISAAVYFLMGLDVISVAGVDKADAPPGIVFVAGGCYVLGGLLILSGKRWLWIIGLVMNTLVIAMFFAMYNQKPEVMVSLAGLATKIAQGLLEAGLVYMIATYRRNELPVYHGQ
jgi:hypothetical protein